jgi:alpha-galactosidase
MIAHNLPRPGGQLPAPRWNASSSLWYEEMGKADEASQIQFIDGYLKNDLKIDFWWMDAGWYFHGGGGWPRTGTWEVDTQRFPRGLRAVTDYAHSKGIKIIVWFEPERVTPGTWLYEKRPKWLLGKDGEQKLLNLGNPEARQWLTDHVDKLLTEQGIDLYRQDFNMEALPYWRANDTEDRQGITEIRHVEGYLAYWDELQRRHPNTLFDTCASGGRRDDLETLRRAVPLHRSDYIFEPVGQQCHTYGLAMWVPFYGIGINTDDPYIVRSMMCPSFGTGPDLRREGVDYSGWRRRGAEWRSIAPYFYGDYYPLTPYSLDNHAWLAWQFDRPDLGEGVVQAFRRAESFYESARFKLQGLEPEAHYVLTDCDDPTPRERTGRELMEQGLPVAIKPQPGAAIITYRVTVNR